MTFNWYKFLAIFPKNFFSNHLDAQYYFFLLSTILIFAEPDNCINKLVTRSFLSFTLIILLYFLYFFYIFYIIFLYFYKQQRCFVNAENSQSKKAKLVWFAWVKVKVKKEAVGNFIKTNLKGSDKRHCIYRKILAFTKSAKYFNRLLFSYRRDRMR